MSEEAMTENEIERVIAFQEVNGILTSFAAFFEAGSIWQQGRDEDICHKHFEEFEKDWRKGLKSDSHMQGQSDGAFDCGHSIGTQYKEKKC
jgi:hypothetical protein